MSQALRRCSFVPTLVWALALSLAILVSLPARPALAQITINVTTTADNMTTPCTALPPCTLRGAVLEANADPGSTINVPGGPTQYVLDHNRGSLIVAAPVTIRGTGSAGNALINGQDSTNQVPVLVNNAAGLVALSGLTVMNGLSASVNMAGGISNTGSAGNNGNMSLTNVTVTNNGGPLAGGIQTNGTLTLTNSTVSGNTATSPFGTPAGGFLVSGNLTMTNSNVSGNTGTGIASGGIFGLGAQITLNNTSVNGNTGARDGGITTRAVTLTVNGGSISNNVGGTVVGGVELGIDASLTATGTSFSTNTGPEAGAILTVGPVTLNGVSISGNSSASQGGGVVVGVPGLPGSATIDQSTISDNSTSAGLGVGGGGIAVHDGSTLTLTRSTVATNRTPGVGGGLLATGTGTSVGLTNDTFSGNTASLGGGIFHGTVPGPAVPRTSALPALAPSSNQQGRGAAQPRASVKQAAPPIGVSLDLDTVAGNTATSGGGIDNVSGPALPFRIHNSIVALNTGSGPDCQGSVSSQGYNLESATSCAFAAAGDSQNTDPMLAGLASNGGPTQTRALLAGSPAIDSADPSCPAGGAEATDQRGVTRPIGGACDKGAFEAPAPVLPAPPLTGAVGDASAHGGPVGATLPALLGFVVLVAVGAGGRRRGRHTGE